MCFADQHWIGALPLVLFRIRTAFKEDLQASTAELVYSEPLRIPGELLTPTADPVDPAHLITELRQHMAHLRPIPATRRALEPPYKVLSWREKTMKILLRDRPITVPTDRVKPAYILSETVRGTTTTTPAQLNVIGWQQSVA
jgi:hypothetical protein